MHEPSTHRGLSMALTTLAAACTALFLAGCASRSGAAGADRSVTIERTTYGIPHITANAPESLAYGVAYAYAQDNVCMTADQLVTARGQRSSTFGAQTIGLLGRRYIPNAQIDLFMAAHMDDAMLERAWAQTSAETQALARGYVAGYNRFLADNAATLPEACRGKPWVQPMTLAQYRRMAEVVAVQAGIAALADGMLGAQPPAAKAAQAPAADVNLADAAQALRDVGLLDSPLGSNAWTFGKDVTANGSGMLLGNPHFPWSGPNRFYEMHLTIPGQMDVMGGGIGTYTLDATLGSVQRPAITEEAIALHGGEEFEGVLNNLGRQEPAPINKAGLRIDYGTSYVQTVTFDAKGPVAQAILTYGQSTNPASPHANDQMREFSAKRWHALPFHRDDVVKARVGDPLRLVRP